ncbi:MAG: AP2/ERF family transcription factor [bacterium]
MTLARDRTRAGKVVWRYIASWPTRDGKRGKVTFSVARYGRAEARRLAIQARQEGLQQEGAQASLVPPAKPPWKNRRGR